MVAWRSSMSYGVGHRRRRSPMTRLHRQTNQLIDFEKNLLLKAVRRLKRSKPLSLQINKQAKLVRFVHCWRKQLPTRTYPTIKFHFTSRSSLNSRINIEIQSAHILMSVCIMYHYVRMWLIPPSKRKSWNAIVHSFRNAREQVIYTSKYASERVELSEDKLAWTRDSFQYDTEYWQLEKIAILG